MSESETNSVPLCYDSQLSQEHLLKWRDLNYRPLIPVADFVGFCKEYRVRMPLLRWVFWLDPQGLAVRELTIPPPGPVRVDLVNAQLQWRLHHGGARSELLARACGLHRHQGATPMTVCDATAGWAQDAVLLAYLGAEVWMCERSPWMRMLVEDGLERANRHPLWMEIQCRLHWVGCEAVSWLATQSEKAFDVIYLDPMFNGRHKSVKSKKEMTVLQLMVGEDTTDASALLEMAYRCARKKIVVKRPRQAPFLAGKVPDQQVSGRSVRFDVYQSPRKTSPLQCDDVSGNGAEPFNAESVVERYIV